MNGSDHEQQSKLSSNKRVNKRLKVGRACYTCRAKKIKVNMEYNRYTQTKTWNLISYSIV